MNPTLGILSPALFFGKLRAVRKAQRRRATWGPCKHRATEEDELGPEPFHPLTSSSGKYGPVPGLEFGALLLSHSVGKSEEQEVDRGAE